MKGTWLFTLLLGVALSGSVLADHCVYRKNAQGQTRYECDQNQRGDIRRDSMGTVRDSGTGIRWRKSSDGSWYSNDGQRMRQDPLGRVHQSDGTIWRTDSLGRQKASDGTECRTDSLGRTVCDGGNSVPPSVIMGK